MMRAIILRLLMRQRRFLCRPNPSVYALKSKSKPYYLKGRLLKECLDDAVEC